MMSQGFYLATIRQGLVSKTQKGNPQVAITITVTAEAQNGEWVNVQPFDRTMYWSLVGGAKPFTQDRLKRIGFNGDGANMQFSAGTDITVECHHETWEGKTREKWDLPADGQASAAEPADANTVRQFNAEWKQFAQAAMKPAGRPAAPPAKAAPALAPIPDEAEAAAVAQAPTGDAIPF